MDLINKGFSSLLIIALVFIAVSFLINILPVLVLIGAGVRSISWTVKKVKVLLKDRKIKFGNKFNDVEIISNENFSEENIIDVEYTEI